MKGGERGKRQAELSEEGDIVLVGEIQLEVGERGSTVGDDGNLSRVEQAVESKDESAEQVEGGVAKEARREDHLVHLEIVKVGEVERRCRGGIFNGQVELEVTKV